MSTDIEDRLREGMARFTADLRAQAGMVHRAELRRRRQLARRSVVAMAAVATCAAVVVDVLVPGAQHRGGTGRPAVDVAYVANRVGGALSAAAPAAIAHMTISSDVLGSSTTAEEWSSGDQWRYVMYSSAGQPIYDAGGTASTYTLVNYQARTWDRQRGVLGQAPSAAGQNACKQAGAALSMFLVPAMAAIGSSAGSAPATVVTLLRTAISCGTLTEAGHQFVDGIDAIELASNSNGLLAETIWVSPTTYLPVRVVIRPAAGSPVSQRTADFRWLKPTVQNWAELTVPIPAGFRQVPFAPTVSSPSP